MAKRVERTERKNEHIEAAEAVKKAIEEKGVRDGEGRLVEPYAAWHRRLKEDLRKWNEWIARARQAHKIEVTEPAPAAPGEEGVEDATVP